MCLILFSTYSCIELQSISKTISFSITFHSALIISRDKIINQLTLAPAVFFGFHDFHPFARHLIWLKVVICLFVFESICESIIFICVLFSPPRNFFYGFSSNFILFLFFVLFVDPFGMLVSKARLIGKLRRFYAFLSLILVPLFGFV